MRNQSAATASNAAKMLDKIYDHCATQADRRDELQRIINEGELLVELARRMLDVNEEIDDGEGWEAVNVM